MVKKLVQIVKDASPEDIKQAVLAGVAVMVMLVVAERVWPTQPDPENPIRK